MTAPPSQLKLCFDTTADLISFDLAAPLDYVVARVPITIVGQRVQISGSALPPSSPSSTDELD
jgi:hypothetical protein